MSDVLSTVLNGSWQWHTQQLHMQRKAEREAFHRGDAQGAQGQGAASNDRPVSKQLRQVQQSLRLRNDPRYKEIEHYAEVQSKGTGKHFSQVQKRASVESVGMASVLPQSTEPEVHQAAGGPVMAGRLSWQKAFDTNVRKLMIDFSLTEDPGCRVHHLDRLSDWFKVHGGKQARKEAKAPNFIQVEKNAVPPPGSARSAITGPLSNTTLILAGSLSMGPKKGLTPR